MADLAHIDDKLAKKIAGIVRRLASDRSGEVAVAVEAFGRTPQSAGADIIHAIAERIEHPGDKLRDTEMQENFRCRRRQGASPSKATSAHQWSFPVRPRHGALLPPA